MPVWRQQGGRAANPRDFFPHGVHDRADLGTIADRVATGETEQHAELEHLEQVGERLRVVHADEIIEVLEEDFSGDVVAEILFLKRLPGPIDEDGTPQI